MERKVTLGAKQHVTLIVKKSEYVTSGGYMYSFLINIVLDSYNESWYSGEVYTYEEAAFQAGNKWAHRSVSSYLESSKQTMSERDMELIVKFFEL